ncbi:MAG: class I SAM-dependent methyltransferase [Pseudomonadota bacterium]
MNQWDQLTDIFGSVGEENSILECVADNVHIAWPSIIKSISGEFQEPTKNNALDFGCGGGMFCRKLSQMGFEVTGYDKSDELIKSAKLNVPKAVTLTSSNSVVLENGSYNMINSIMVLQFISDIESIIDNFISILKPNGLVIFSVFNPEFIEDNLNTNVFSDFDSFKTGYMKLKKGLKIPVYNRTEEEYREIFEKRGFEEVYIDYPEFTGEFLKEYQMPFSTKYSEFLIQAFKYK